MGVEWHERSAVGGASRHTPGMAETFQNIADAVNKRGGRHLLQYPRELLLVQLTLSILGFVILWDYVIFQST